LTFTINSMTRCAGQNHWRITVTLGGGATHAFDTSVEEMQAAAPDDAGAARDGAVARLRSALLEANANNWTQAQTALVGKTFKI
jgi:hypothetical protein